MENKPSITENIELTPKKIIEPNSAELSSENKLTVEKYIEDDKQLSE